MGKEMEKIGLRGGEEIVRMMDVNKEEDFEWGGLKSGDVGIEFRNGRGG